MPSGTVPSPTNTTPSPARTNNRRHPQCPETAPNVGIPSAAQHPVSSVNDTLTNVSRTWRVASYLDAGQRAVHGDWFADALNGATREVLGIRALQPTRSTVSMGPAEGYVVHDYLEYHYRPQRRWAIVPGSLWDAVAAHAAGPSDRLRLALAAQHRGLYRHAVRIAGPAARAGDPHAGRLVAQRMLERQRTIDENAYLTYKRYLAQSDDLLLTSGLGDWLIDLGTRHSWDHTLQNLQELDSIMSELHRIEQDGGPEPALEYLVAVSPTAPDSVKVLVVSYLDNLGRRDEALTWQRRLAETGDPGCIGRYAGRSRSGSPIG